MKSGLSDCGADAIASHDAVEAEQIRLLLRNPADVPVNLINAVIVAAIVWPLYPAWVVALWLGMVCIVSLARALLRHAYAVATRDAKMLPVWARVFTLNALVAGCLWGLSASVILMTPDPVYYNFIVFVLGGTMAGGIVCIAVNWRAMLAFILPTILPAIVALAARGGPVQIAMAVMLALFTFALVWTARSINQSIAENVRLRFGQQRMAADLGASEARFRSVTATAQDAIITIDAAARIGLWNGAAERILGYSAEEAVGKQVHELLAPPRFRAKADTDMDLFAVSGTGAAIGKTTELAARRKDGTEIAVELSLAAARLDEGWGAIGILRDITLRKQTEALALRMARNDVLTGLANRAVFVEELQHAIARAKRGEKTFAVLYLDLDHFKDVNDTLGHPMGDELLKAVADRLLGNTRETDTVARFGGDEFAIIVADIRDPADAAMMADKLITAFADPFPVQGNEIHSGVSIGIASYGIEGDDPEALLSHADVALYQAKSEGRGGYRFFTDVMDEEVKTRVALGAELRVAIDGGQLFLMYQPQVTIDTGRITGVEALVRWRHPQRGVLGPGLFIPIAEQIGIIAKLGHWVLWEACRQGRAWLDQGVPPVRIAVNVSALQFRTPVALEADIAAALAQTGLPPDMLELELTESVLMDASRDHNDLLQRLRNTGVTVAIDDFGTGYSSLEYLRKYPSNRIKIAQNFVTNLETTPGDAAIIRATIGLARELNIEVIAEGVETQVQRDLLRDWGCGEVQGYLFAKPLTAEGAGAALRDGKVLPPRTAAIQREASR